MATRVISYRAWQATRSDTREWADTIERALGEPARDRPRDPDKARLLRERGTPEPLIGPTTPRPAPDET